MKKIFSILTLLIAFTLSQAQTQPNLPTGAKPYSGNLFRDLSGNIWTGYAGSYTNLGSMFKVDSLLSAKLDTAALSGFYTKSQVDAFLELKQNLITGAATTIVSDDLTANRALISDGDGKIAVSVANSTELGYLLGLTGNVQDQFGTKIDTALLDKPSGIPLMDANGKIQMVNIPDQLIGAVNFQSAWSAATNTPTLPTTPGPETKGHYYVASDSGVFNGITYLINDWIISSGTEWQKIEATNYVRRVNGQTGDVVITAAGIGAVQTLSQPSIGQIAISDGNTIDLNTVNMSGDQTGIAGNKAWTGTQTISGLSGTGNALAGLTSTGQLTRTAPGDLGFVPYTGATQDVSLGSRNLQLSGGELYLVQPSVIRKRLGAGTSTGNNYRVLHDVANLVRSANTSEIGDIVISFPIQSATKWWLELDLFANSSGNQDPTRLVISAYTTNNSVRSVSGWGGIGQVSEVKYGRIDSNTVLIIKFNSELTNNYVRANIAKFYQTVTYNSNLDDPSNFSVEFLKEEDLVGFTLSGTVTNAQFTRDPYYLDANNFVNMPTIGNGTLTLATGTGLQGSASFSANQSGNATFTVEAASGYTIPTTTQATNWTQGYDYSEIGHIPLDQKGAVNGVATLGAGGVIPWEQLPTSNPYKGTWDASTNTPSITDGTGTAGDYYRVNEPGTQDLGSGNITFAVGDDVIYSGTVWQRVPGGAVATNLGIGTHNGTSIEVTNSNGTGITLPAATTMLSGLQSAADKVLINSAVQPADNISVLTNDAGFIVSGTGDAQVRTNLQLDGRYAQLSGATFTGPVLWSTAPTLGDHLTNKTYVDAEINNAISGIPAGLELGETGTTAYRGDRGKEAYDYSQIGHLELSGGTVTGQIKRDSDAVDGDDLPRLSQVQSLISSISIPEMSLSELNTGTDTTNHSIAAKTLNDWLSAKNYIPVGANNSLLNNNAGYISVGTGNDQVRKNEDLDLRYVQTEADPTVPAYVKNISESDINSWNAKLESVTGSGWVTVDYTDPTEPDVRLTDISRGKIMGLGGGGAQTWSNLSYSADNGYAGEWGPSVVYSSNTYVKYGTVLYKSGATPTVGVPPPGSTWTQVRANFHGTWQPTTQYTTGMSVVLSNVYYSTNATTVGVQPGTTPNNTPGAIREISIGSGLAITGSDGAGWTLIAGSASSIQGTILAGSNITITGVGTQANPYVINSTAGGGGGSVFVQGGTNINVTGSGTSGSPYVINNTYSLPIATGSVLGGVKAGSGVTIAGDGTISVSGGGGGGSGITQLTGDVTTPGGGSGSSTIANSVVTNAKLANMGANTIKGRVSTSGPPQDLTDLQVRQILYKSYSLGASTTINLSNGSKQYASLSANRTYSFTNFDAGLELQVEITNTSGSDVTINFAGGTYPSGQNGSIPPGKTAVFSMTKFQSAVRVTKIIF